MPFDEFKTQVLLLHSEQSTLDSLSAGFNDRYTVHCATSGSEALNTLVETPINIIISAQKLPGMSGLEALREAKKRSPDTVGILLAGNADVGLEALVGEQEVFQVVRGNVTSDSILKLVEGATQQMRLMALAESANDTAANPDEPAAEHIVMETSENGSTIISDGTGRMPALDPKKVSASASVGSRSVDVLVLTKDQEFLETIKDSSRGMHQVYYANTLAQANEAIGKHKVGVAVVDAAMVGDKVEQLTQHLRKSSPRLVSIVAGRRDDGEMLMDLINRGKVYRFLLKPVSPGRARLAVEASVKHHLEAPEAAFVMKGAPAAAPAKPAAKPAPPPPPPKPKVAKKPAAAKPRKPPPQQAAPPPPKPPKQREIALPSDPPLGATISANVDSHSPIDDSLGDAFGQDDASFAETVTGLISSVGKRFSKEADAAEEADDVAINASGALHAPAVSALASDGGDSLSSNPKLLGVAAGAVVILAGALFWFFSGSEEPAVTDAVEIGTPAVSESDFFDAGEPAAEPETVTSSLADDARLARDSGRVFDPAGSNAIELFAAAMNDDPGNAIIAAEFDAVVEQALAMAESAMLESRLDDADAALLRVTEFDAGNPRLPFLTAQLSQMRVRDHLVQARLALRENRFEDAENALAAARALDVADNVDIGTVAEELLAARSAQQVDEVLAKATDRFDAGDLISPANHNARYYYGLVLSNDPENTAARQGLGIIASKLVLQASVEIENGNLNDAEDLLAAARETDPSSTEVGAVAATLVSTRAAIVERNRLAEEARIAESERLAEAERRAEAERLAEAERRAEAERQAAADRAEAQRLAAAAATAGDSAEPERDNTAKPTQPVASKVTDNSSLKTASLATAIPAVTPPARNAANEAPIAVSSLERIKYVAPKYPRAAQRRNLSGWVDVVFTVATDGTVTDITVRDSQPGDTFVASALRAVEKWEFQPIIEDGAFVEKRAGVRMMFALE